MNCRGKHAAMLATCVANGWDTATYLDADHPLQVAIAETFADLTGEKVEVVAVDGCGAPLLSTSLTGLARAFRALSLADRGTGAARRRRHPGAPGVHLRHPPRRGRPAAGDPRRDRQGRAPSPATPSALADGRAVALKTDDGAARVRPVLMAAALERLGVTGEPASTVTPYDGRASCELLGGGRPVGEIRATF